MRCTKTTQLIIERGNDYVVTVKGNQPRLFEQLQTKAERNRCPGGLSMKYGSVRFQESFH